MAAKSTSSKAKTAKAYGTMTPAVRKTAYALHSQLGIKEGDKADERIDTAIAAAAKRKKGK